MTRKKVITILIIVLIVILAMLGMKIFLNNFQWTEHAPPRTNKNTVYVKQGTVSDDVINSDVENIIEELNKEESNESSVHNVEISLQGSSKSSQNKKKNN